MIKYIDVQDSAGNYGTVEYNTETGKGTLRDCNLGEFPFFEDEEEKEKE